MQNYLFNHQLFKGTDENLVRKLWSNHSIYSREYNKGFTLHSENTTCETLDIVRSGTLIAYLLDKNGNSLIMFSFHRNDVIGANLLFAENGIYPLNIYCETDCEVIHVSRDAITSLLSDQAFTFSYIRYVSDITQNVNRKIFIISGKSLRERIIEYMKNESVRQNSNRIKLPVSKKQLADILGVQRPSLFRELKNMKEEGLLDYNNRSVTLRF